MMGPQTTGDKPDSDDEMFERDDIGGLLDDDASKDGHSALEEVDTGLYMPTAV